MRRHAASRWSRGVMISVEMSANECQSKHFIVVWCGDPISFSLICHLALAIHVTGPDRPSACLQCELQSTSL
jgi:hypothetical protein